MFDTLSTLNDFKMLSFRYDWNFSLLKFLLSTCVIILSILFERASRSSCFNGLVLSFGLLPTVFIAFSVSEYGNFIVLNINLNGAITKSTNGLVFLSFVPSITFPSLMCPSFAISLYFFAIPSKPLSSSVLITLLNVSRSISCFC